MRKRLNKILDLTGVRFGRLLACYPVGIVSQKGMHWACICDCGGRHLASSGALRSGSTISCGCYRRENGVERGKISSARRFIDLTGRRIGRLHVDDIAYRRNGKTYWRCECDCGRSRIINGDSLRNEHTRSCGCLRDELISQVAKMLNPKKKKVA